MITINKVLVEVKEDRKKEKKVTGRERERKRERECVLVVHTVFCCQYLPFHLK